MATSDRRVPPPIVATALLAGLIAVLYWPVLLGESTFVHGDSLSVSLPLQKLLADGLAEWRIPQWTPALYGGHPIHAEGQGGFLHPLNWLLFGTLPRLFDRPEDAIGAGTLYAHGLLHLACTWIAALGAFGLARCLGVGVSAALFGALALAFSPDWLGGSANSAIAVSTAFVPAAVWALERWWQAPSLSRAAILGMAAAAVLLGGYPQAAHAFVLLSAVWLAARVDGGRARDLGAHALTGSAAVAVAAGLAAAQLLPTGELASLSVRADGVELAYSGSWSRQLAGIFFLPGRDVEPGVGSALVLLLAGVGLLGSRAPLRLRMGLLLSVLLLLQLALADASPLDRALRALVPGLGLFRITHLYGTVAVLPLAMLAALGVERVVHERGTRVLVHAGGVAVVLGAAALLARTPDASLLALLPGALGLALLAGALRVPAGAAPAAVLVALLAIEIAVLRAPLVDPPAFDVARRPPSTAVFLLAQTEQKLGSRVATVPHVFTPLGFATSRSPALEKLARDFLPSLYAGSNLLWGVSSLDANLALPLARRSAVDPLVEREVLGAGARAPGQRFVDRQSLRYVVGQDRARPISYAPDLRRVHADPGGRFVLLENPNARPRVEVVPQGRIAWVADLEAAVSRFESGASEGAVLEGRAPATARAAAEDGVLRVLDARLEPERIRVTVTSPGEAVVTIADAPHPGWRAFVDGAPAEIFPANVLGKGVRVGPGRHQVELRFASRPFRWGAAVSGATALALVAGFGLRALRALRARRAGTE